MPYYPWFYDQFPYIRRSFPVADASQFVQSALQMDGLMADAKKLTAYLSASKEQSKKIIEAARKSNKPLVIKLLRSSGIVNELDTEFNPDGIRLILFYKNPDLKCCSLILILRW
jgi:hypothetical protein